MTFWADRSVVVIGGASFIGSHLVDRLALLGASVRVLDDFSSGTRQNLECHLHNPSVTIVEGDARDEATSRSIMQGADVVFHLAADHGGRGYVDTHQGACATNLGLDAAVFAAALKSSVGKVVYASSGCVYPNYMQTDVNADLYLSEDMVGPPHDADGMYGWAKLMGEKTLAAFHRDYGLKAASCRYFTVYGERGVENHSIMSMIARACVGQSPFEVWGDGEQIRNWTYVSDIVEGTMLAAQHIDDGTAVNLGTMERTRVATAARMILDYLGLSTEIVFRPDLPVGPVNRVADNSFARELLQWSPKVAFRDGLHKTIDWYRATRRPAEIHARLERLLVGR